MNMIEEVRSRTTTILKDSEIRRAIVQAKYKCALRPSDRVKPEDRERVIAKAAELAQNGWY